MFRCRGIRPLPRADPSRGGPLTARRRPGDRAAARCCPLVPGFAGRQEALRGRTELHWELAPPRPASQDAGGGAQAGWVRVGNASGLGAQGEARPGKARRFSRLWLETKPAGGAGPSRAHGAPRGRLRGLGTLGRGSWRGPGQRSHCGDSPATPPRPAQRRLGTRGRSVFAPGAGISA